jgi:hypothetical protein
MPLVQSAFQAKEVKREQLENPYEVRTPEVRGGFVYERIENLRVTYKCKSCGHEWTDVEAKTIHDHLKLWIKSKTCRKRRNFQSENSQIALNRFEIAFGSNDIGLL